MRVTPSPIGRGRRASHAAAISGAGSGCSLSTSSSATIIHLRPYIGCEMGTAECDGQGNGGLQWVREKPRRTVATASRGRANDDSHYSIWTSSAVLCAQLSTKLDFSPTRAPSV